LSSCELVTGEMLAFSTAWEHRVGDSGITISFTLPDGRALGDRDIDGVLNRLMTPPHDLAEHAVPGDREYAQQEMMAFHLSWLNALRVPVLNRPTPQGLPGRWFHASELVMLAHRAGLQAPAYRQSGDDVEPGYGYASLAPIGARMVQIIVLDDDAFGAALPQDVRDGCVRFAKLAETRLVGVDLYHSPDRGWTFAHATPMPALQLGGDSLLRGLAQIFTNEALR
jgi:hypothetical protein